MHRILAVAAAAALFASATACHAAALLFHFDPANSSVAVTQNDPDCWGSCALSAHLLLPFSDLTVEEGAANAQSFDFANFNVAWGFGGDDDARVEAVLAFTSPSVDAASTGGTADYFAFGGVFTAGSLIWDNPVQNFTTADGSTFSVSFGDLRGVTFGSNAIAPVTITVDSVAAAVPEPASWALMIGGFGMAGAMLRRRQSLAAAA
jgi:PEP-CTERM motif-containing protein